MKINERTGFTLIELMIVVAMIAVLSMIAIPNFNRFLAKAKRAEAYVQLANLALLEKSYWAEHGHYTTALSGSNSLGWKPEGKLQYSYGFAEGVNGINHLIGALGTPSSALQGAQINPERFVIFAAGSISSTDKPDILAIDQTGKIEIIQDALA